MVAAGTAASSTAELTSLAQVGFSGLTRSTLRLTLQRALNKFGLQAAKRAFAQTMRRELNRLAVQSQNAGVRRAARELLQILQEVAGAFL